MASCNTSDRRKTEPAPMTKTDLIDNLTQIYHDHTKTGMTDPSWSAFFEGISNSSLTEGPRNTTTLDPYRSALILGRIIEHYRWRGHTAARLDPLGISDPVEDSELALDVSALSIGMRDNASQSELTLSLTNAADLIKRLKDIYCGSIGFEYMHLDDPIAREWLRQSIEDNKPTICDKERLAGAKRLIEAEEFELFTQKRFSGKKLFGAEGAESLLSLLGIMKDVSVDHGVKTMIIGGTSRARLNQLVNFVGKPAVQIFQEISDGKSGFVEPEISGDVSYHLGYTCTQTIGDKEMTLSYCANPSHLEAINTVALGRVRALQDMDDGQDPQASTIALLVHTDAAFAGQGVVAETFQISALPSYTVGGTLHVVINNQIGFTTEPSNGRSSRYCTDVAKGIGAPVFHVNADDLNAVLWVGKLAAEYRARFRRDVVVDLVCYRGKGHNELDEPNFTQPRMYQTISAHISARRRTLDHLFEEKKINDRFEHDIADTYRTILEESYKAALSYKSNAPLAAKTQNPTAATPSIKAEMLRNIGRKISRIPAGVTAHFKIERIFTERNTSIESGKDINWGLAEALALGSILQEGKAIRFSGQDTPRGAFSHRHYFVHDQRNGTRHSIFDELQLSNCPTTITESPLAEYATLGFEYGYSLEAANTLVVWEAQFGDFANVAQPIFDQFMFSGEDKWGQQSRLTVLMPHGLEGQGSEHSSGRIERFLQMAARDNVMIANCTTPANYFHLIRQQSLRGKVPLMIFTPKSLLRHKLAVSSFEHMESQKGFEPILTPHASENIKRLILCSGKIYWEIEAERLRLNLGDIGIGRLEQLYPFPTDQVCNLLRHHKKAELVWCQEEPANMGAWSFVLPLLNAIVQELGHVGRNVTYIGRPANPSPSFGSTTVHTVHQARIIARALGQTDDMIKS